MTAPVRPVALVTGAGRGIGAAVVDTFVSQGWHVVATDACTDDPALAYPLASQADLADVAARHGDQVMTCEADVRDEEALLAAVSAAVERFGRLDTAVAGAGVLAGGKPAWETSEEHWQAQIDVNLTGVWRLARAAIPALLATPDLPDGVGPSHHSFVAVSSTAGTRGLPLLAAYAASKHGVVGLVTSMAAELGPHGVTANVVCPGSTRTPILSASADVYGLDDREEFAQHHLLPRLLEPGEVAEAIAFLCGPGGSGITGAVVPVDAGMGAT